MKLFNSLLLMLFLVAGSTTVALAGKPMSVAFLNPGGQGDAFFDMMTSFMQAAADDLGIELEVIYCDRDHLKLHEEGVKLLKRDKLPDYLILINEKNGAVDILESASNKGVKVALINEGLHLRDRMRLGEPGETLHNWVFELLPDDLQAGRMLAQALTAEAKARGQVDQDSQIKLVGIAGTFQTGSSELRVLGMRRTTMESGQARLMQVVPAYWEEERAAQVTAGLLKRYPEVRVVWAASDLMARGVLKGAKAAGIPPSSIITGGIDWTEFALHEVAKGNFAATVGGHFMDGGWALVMLYDLHHGIALPQKHALSPFSLINKDNVDDFLSHFGSHEWSIIDFSQFSRKLNPEQIKYRFGLTAVLKQMHDH